MILHPFLLEAVERYDRHYLHNLVGYPFETTLAEGVRFERRTFHATFAFDDRTEGMSAFADKRKAAWKHR